METNSDMNSFIWYYESGKVEREIWCLDDKKHRADGPAVISYYKTGEIEYKSWWVNGKLFRATSPNIIWYYKNGDIQQEEWYINDKKLDSQEIIKYKKWLEEYCLNDKSYDQWTDEEKVLWRLSWM